MKSIVITYSEPVLGALTIPNYTLTGTGNTLSVDDVLETGTEQYTLDVSGNAGTDDVFLTINGISNQEGGILQENQTLFPIDRTGPEIYTAKCYAEPHPSNDQFYFVYIYFKQGVDTANISGITNANNNFSFNIIEGNAKFYGINAPLITYIYEDGKFIPFTKEIQFSACILTNDGNYNPANNVMVRVTASNIRDRCGNTIDNNGVSNYVDIWMERP